jgi:ligand-binding sensor domain-containing protein
MKSGVLALVLAGTFLAGGAGTARADGAIGPLTGHTLASWTINDGVPLGAVYAVAQDADGYLWLGTADGVVRFDGARFTPWRMLHATTLPRGAVYALSRSDDGTLWVGFEGDGHVVTVWALRGGHAVVSDDGTPPRAPTTAVFRDRTGSVWAISGGTLYRWRGGRWDAFMHGPLPAHEVVSVGELANGELWIGTRGGLFRLDRTHDTFVLVEPGIVREFSQSRDGQMWISDAGHAARRLSANRPPPGLEGLRMRLLNDSRGNLWAATTGQGLWRVRDVTSNGPPLVEHLTAQTGLSSDAVEALYEDREGNVWIGTTQGLHSLTPHVLTPVRAGAFVRMVLPDADGTMWAGTANGLVRFRRQAGTWVPEHVGPTGIDVRRLSHDANGRLRVETNADIRTPAPKRVYDGRAAVLEHRDGVGNVFTALQGGSLLIERANGSRSVLEAPNTAPSGEPDSIDAIYEDRRGTVWIGGTRGLCRVSGTSLACLGGDGLPARRVFALNEDDDGDLWLLLDRGSAFAGRRAALARLHTRELAVSSDKVVHCASLGKRTHGG